MTNQKLEYEYLSDNSYNPSNGGIVTLGNVKYRIYDSMDRPSGYQATAYQRLDDNHVFIANRGTEFNREPILDGLKSDGGMVRNNVNDQYKDAQEFAHRLIEKLRL